MKKSLYLFLLILFSSLFFIQCKDDEPDPGLPTLDITGKWVCMDTTTFIGLHHPVFYNQRILELSETAFSYTIKTEEFTDGKLTDQYTEKMEGLYDMDFPQVNFVSEKNILQGEVIDSMLMITDHEYGGKLRFEK